MNNLDRRSPFRRVHVVPSLLTLGNFACGFFAIVMCLNALFYATRAQMLVYDDDKQPPAAAVVGDGTEDAVGRADVMTIRSSARGANARAMHMFHWACIVIFVGMVFDMLDGKVARHMGASSQFGAELDSLADVTTFGVAPPIIVTTLWISAMPLGASWWGQVMIFGVVYAVCGVLRLARYNVQAGTADKNYFTGLPIPAAAGCVVTAVLMAQGDYFFVNTVCDWIANMWDGVNSVQVKTRILGMYLVVPGLLMVSEIKYSHLANRYLSGANSFYSLVAAVLLLALVWHEPRIVLFLLFNGYMLFGVLSWLWRRKREKGGDGEVPGEADNAPA